MACVEGDASAERSGNEPKSSVDWANQCQLPHAEPSENARAIRQLGGWIPGVLSASSLKGSKDERNAIAQIYREEGLNIYAAHEGEQADVYQLWQMLAKNRIKAFASLAGFLAAYRTGDEEALLLRCCQALVVRDQEVGGSNPLAPTTYPLCFH